MSGSSRSFSSKEDEQEPQLTPGQTVSSLAGTTLDYTSRQAGQGDHSSGSYKSPVKKRRK